MSLKNEPTSKIRDKLGEKANNQMSGLSAITHRPIPLLLGLLAAWIIGGAWLYRIVCCNSPATLSPLLIQDGSIPVASATESLRFMKGEAIPIIGPTIESELQKAANYVSERPNKVLFINGKYNLKELADGDDTNLGEARANSLKQKFTGWGLDADYIFTNGASSKLMAPVRDTVYGAADFKIKTIPNRYLEFATPDGFKAGAKDNLTFGANGATIGEPIPDSVQQVAKQLASYLKANPDKSLLINGWYGNDETYDGDLANLGEARGNALKSWWVKMGVSADQIKVNTAAKDDLLFISDKLYGGADYMVGSEQEIADQNAKNAASNLGTSKNNIAFTPDSYEMGSVSPDMKAKLEALAAYLKANPDKRLRITGLFDKGEKYNGSLANLGEARAKTISDFMKTLGVNADQLAMDSKDRATVSNDILGGAMYAIETNPNYKKGTADNSTSDSKVVPPPPSVTIYFDYKSTTPKISTADRDKLIAYAKYLAANKSAKAVAEGHADNIGSTNYNLKLSRQRSIAIENFLAQQGASKGQIETKGFGFSQRVGSNESESERAKDRRVELKILN